MGLGLISHCLLIVHVILWSLKIYILYTVFQSEGVLKVGGGGIEGVGGGRA